MALGMGILPAQATTTDNIGAIIISNATVGEQYKLYKLFDGQLSDYRATETDETGAAGRMTYIANSSQKQFFETYAPDAFEFEDVEDNVRYTQDSDKKYYVSTERTGEELASILQGVIKVQSDGSNTAITKAFAKTFQAVTPSFTINMDGTIAKDKKIEMRDLPLGYYFVDSSLGAMVTLTSTSPEAYITDKNSVPYSDTFKKIESITQATTGKVITDIDDEITVGVGDVIKYSLTIHTKDVANGKNILSYLITDTLSDGLEYVHSSTGSVYTYYYDNVDVTSFVSGTESQLYSDYDTYYRENSEYQQLMNYKSRMAFDYATYKLLENQDAHYNNLPTTKAIDLDDDVDDNNTVVALPEYSTDDTLVVYYSAVVKDDIASYGQYTNTAHWWYVTEDNEIHDGGEGTTTVYPFGLNIYKTDADYGEPLADATFNLSVTNSHGDEETLYFKKLHEEDTVYLYDPDSMGTTDLTSDATGNITVIGLPEDTYYLTEVKAPGGYTKVDKPQTIEPSEYGVQVSIDTNGYASYGRTKAVVVKKIETKDGKLLSESSNVLPQSLDDDAFLVETEGDEDIDTQGLEANLSSIANANTYYLTLVEVENYKTTNLPSTGGMGTTIFYIAGSILVIGAVIFLITNRRMKAE
jgi:LPXTG-motif cell wall-anchored protein